MKIVIKKAAQLTVYDIYNLGIPQVLNYFLHRRCDPEVITRQRWSEYK